MSKSIERGEDAEWERGFCEFLRATRLVSDKTIDKYIAYIKNVAEAIGQRPEDMAKNDKELDDVLGRINDMAWKRSTKDDYGTAVRGLCAFHKLKESGESSGRIVAPQLLDAIKSQINAVELIAFEQSGNAWRTVFGIFTGYALVLPPLLLSGLNSKLAMALVFCSILVAFLGVRLFIPVLCKPARQLRDIQKRGEDIVSGITMDFWYSPKIWTVQEKICGIGSGIALLGSVLLLGTAKFIDVFAK